MLTRPEAIANAAMECVKEDRFEDYLAFFDDDSVKSLAKIMRQLHDFFEKWEDGLFNDVFPAMHDVDVRKMRTKKQRIEGVAVFLRSLLKAGGSPLYSFSKDSELDEVGVLFYGKNKAYVVMNVGVKYKNKKALLPETISMSKKGGKWYLAVPEAVQLILRKQLDELKDKEVELKLEKALRKGLI